MILLMLYVAGFIFAWLMLQGWGFAYWQCSKLFDAAADRGEDKSFSAGHAILGAMIWPIMLPIQWIGVQYGWLPVWASDEQCEAYLKVHRRKR